MTFLKFLFCWLDACFFMTCQLLFYSKVCLKIMDTETKLTKQNSRNLIKEINTWTVSVIRYLEPFVKWPGEPKQMDQWTKKLMTMHEAIYLRDDVDIIIMSHHQHGYPWPFLAALFYCPLLLAGLQGFILYRHRAAVCWFELVILPLLVRKKKIGRGLASTGDITDASTQRLKGYIQKNGGRLITATRNNREHEN